MKKYFLLTAMAGLALTSCVKNEFEVPQTGGDKVISFAAPVVSSLTRTNVDNPEEVGNNYPTGSNYNFAVWAHYYEGDYTNHDEGMIYMQDVTVSYDNATASWLPIAEKYYWPKNGTLTFIGYSPASVNATIDTYGKGIVFTDYVVSTTQNDQLDLLFSEKTYNQKKYSANADDKTTDDTQGTETTGGTSNTTDDVYTGAHMVFKHALSSILFCVKTSEDYTTSDKTEITLTGITLNNVVRKGSFAQGLSDGNNEQTKAPTLSNGKGDNWTLSTEASDKISYVAYTNKTGASSTGILLKKSECYWPSTGTYSANVHTQYNGGLRKTDLILLPQPIKDIKVTIDYTIKSKDSAPIAQTSTININSDDNADWDWGYRYIYTITIGLEKITIEPYVTPWEDQTGSGTI